MKNPKYRAGFFLRLLHEIRIRPIAFKVTSREDNFNLIAIDINIIRFMFFRQAIKPKNSHKNADTIKELTSTFGTNLPMIISEPDSFTSMYLKHDSS